MLEHSFPLVHLLERHHVATSAFPSCQNSSPMSAGLPRNQSAGLPRNQAEKSERDSPKEHLTLPHGSSEQAFPCLAHICPVVTAVSSRSGRYDISTKKSGRFQAPALKLDPSRGAGDPGGSFQSPDKEAGVGLPRQSR